MNSATLVIKSVVLPVVIDANDSPDNENFAMILTPSQYWSPDVYDC